jgi:hypothetical protein
MLSVALAGCSGPAPPPAGPAVQLSQHIRGMGFEIIDTPLSTTGVKFNLTSFFAINDTIFHCVIATNDYEFIMPTFNMGNATIPKNALYMAMDSVSVSSVRMKNATWAEINGTIRSITRVGTNFEDATVPFEADFFDAGPGPVGDLVQLHPAYNETASPMQYAIFGPQPHFGHGVISGDILVWWGSASGP